MYNEILMEMVKDPLLSDINPDTLSSLSEFEMEKMLAKEKGELISIHIQKFTGQMYGESLLIA